MKKLLARVIPFFLFSLLFFAFCIAEESGERELAYINKLVTRSKQFESVMNSGDYSKLRELFPINHTSKISSQSTKEIFAGRVSHECEIVFWIENCTEGQKILQKEKRTKLNFADTSNYCITIQDRPLGSLWILNWITMLFYQNTSSPPSSSMLLANYGESGLTLDLVDSRMELRRDGSPYFCEIDSTRTVIEYGVTKPALVSRVEWDDKGTITKKEDLHYMRGHDIGVKFPNVKVDNAPPKLLPKKKYQFPESEYADVTDVFKRLKTLYSARKVEYLADALHWKLMDTKPKALMARGGLYLASKNVCIAFIANTENRKLQGYALSLDDKGTILSYAEGIFSNSVSFDGEQDENTSWTEFWTHDLSKRLQEGFYWANDIPVKLFRGVEIKFHDTGYPKSYRSLVRGRLYGRQIEWNDRGRVISDVDIDIPAEIENK